jgi:predicted Fe-Mo cluster-binding NifX family protein
MGATNIYDPLEKAFQFTEDPGKAKPGIVGQPVAKGVEVIFLLSDGMPNFGQIQQAGAIIKKIAEINKLKKVIINTIFCGSKDAPDFKEGKKFMKKLAKKNGGQFVERY